MTEITMNTAMYYAGKAIEGQGPTFEVINPVTESVIVKCKAATTAQVNDAVLAAKKAFEQWQYTSDEQIRLSLDRIAQDIKAERSVLAELITLEQGKPLFLAEMEVDMALYWLEVTNQFEVPVLQHTDPMGKQMSIFHRPLGVIASITPWNWPFMIAIWHLIPALKTKNCVINKPSEFTPLSTIKLIEIIQRHVPAGVCNLVLGAGEVGAALSQHPEIEKVVFTGSTAVGKKILSAATDQLKHVVLELGGNDAAIVLQDVDVAETAQKIFMSAFLNAGQTCACIKRLYVHESIFDQMVAALAQIADAQVLGNGRNTDTTLGPVQNRNQYLKVKNMIEDAVAQGAKIANQNLARVPEAGYFIAPLILTDVDEHSEIFAKEQFGPVLPVVSFRNIDEVIAQSNQSSYALGGSVWTQDMTQAHQIAAKMQTGTVWINSHADVSPFAEFGGWKQSGLGYAFGLDGLLMFTKKQAIQYAV
ncbi:aldehyde dehydrogenase family protein [Acinetobacter soli]|uniref:aldehyde dehydrogenase family protein n=1 Tax=Acinetobacter soli TaxID=487316 RepID=UPI0026DFDA8C|nr:aldehyde dehydrogenase family protein [Acinetobacter soli]